MVRIVFKKAQVWWKWWWFLSPFYTIQFVACVLYYSTTESYVLKTPTTSRIDDSNRGLERARDVFRTHDMSYTLKSSNHTRQIVPCNSAITSLLNTRRRYVRTEYIAFLFTWKLYIALVFCCCSCYFLLIYRQLITTHNILKKLDTCRVSFLKGRLSDNCCKKHPSISLQKFTSKGKCGTVSI